ncbi:LirA/MavJ family T4SS effector [Aquicella siphonis]|nr:LirA/MavJ family T4SS effector [Aquicella siphonis]
MFHDDYYQILKREFDRDYPSLDEKAREDFAHIGALLSNGERCIPSLKSLNSLLIQLAKENGLYEAILQENQSDKNPSAKRIAKNYKLLSSLLSSWFDHFQFNQVPDLEFSPEGKAKIIEKSKTGEETPRYGKTSLWSYRKTPSMIGGDLSPDLIRKIIALGFHFKDPEVSPRHGDFTHQLQWFIVTDCWNKGMLKLNFDPVILYKLLGEPATQKEGESPVYLWDRILDRIDTPIDEFIFIRPEALTHFLLKEANEKKDPELAFLSLLVNNRYNKRMDEYQARRRGIPKEYDESGLQVIGAGEEYKIYILPTFPEIPIPDHYNDTYLIVGTGSFRQLYHIDNKGNKMPLYLDFDKIKILIQVINQIDLNQVNPEIAKKCANDMATVKLFIDNGFFSLQEALLPEHLDKLWNIMITDENKKKGYQRFRFAEESQFQRRGYALWQRAERRPPLDASSIVEQFIKENRNEDFIKIKR